jgi:hypothetical protein
MSALLFGYDSAAGAVRTGEPGVNAPDATTYAQGTAMHGAAMMPQIGMHLVGGSLREADLFPHSSRYPQRR